MKYIIAILLLSAALSSQAQHIADTFQQAEKTGHSMQHLDEIYPSALHSDSTKAVFKGKEQGQFIGAYKTMLFDLNSYLNKNGFSWDKPTRIFNRIYFQSDGSIDYYLVNLENTGISDEKAKQFIPLLNKFVAFYKIKITASTKFAQCSPVLYQNAEQTTGNSR
jgi:hypothetical protein